MKKFYNYESGEILIDEQSLYDFLFLKGVRCFKIPNEEHRLIVIFLDDTITLYYLEDKLWRFSYWLFEQEFTSVTEEEMNQVKKALKKCKGTLKKRYLTQLEIEDLEKCEKSHTKEFLQKIIEESGVEKGDSNGD